MSLSTSMADRLQFGQFIFLMAGKHPQVARVVRVEKASGYRRIVCAFQRRDGQVVTDHVVKSLSARLLGDDEVEALRRTPEFANRLDFPMPGEPSAATEGRRR